MTRIKRKRITVVLGLVMASLLIAGGSLLRAEEGDATVLTKRTRRRHRVTTTTYTTTTTAPPAGRSIDELQGQVSNLRAQTVETNTEVKQIQQAITVAPPATANAAPKTIGEHVSVVEQELGDVRKTLADHLGVHIHGLVDANYEYNFNLPLTTPLLSSSGRVNQLRTFDVDANSFTFEQFNLHIDRTTEGGVGFVTDLNFGKTAEVLFASTHYSNSTTPQTTEEFDPTQAYLTYTVPLGKGINLQAGKFVTLLGAEVIDVYNNQNFNETHSYIFGFGIPFTHTGIRAQYSFNDKIGLTMGFNNGWDDPSDNNDGKSLEGQLALTPTSSLSLLISGMYGPEQANHGNSKRGIIDPVLTYTTPIKGLQLIGEYMYAHEDAPVSVVPFSTSQGNSLNLGGVLPFGTAVTIPHGVNWQAFAGYVVYDLNDNWRFAIRGEWFEDSDGARTGLRQTLAEVTGTVRYKVPLVSGLMAQAEYRHDESSAHPFFSNDGFVTNASKNLEPIHTYSGQDTILVGGIYTF